MAAVPKGTNHPLSSIVLRVIQTLRGPFPTQLMSLGYKRTGWKNMVTVTYIKIDILILHVLYKDRKINVTANKLNLLFIKFSHLFPNFIAEGTLEERFAIKTAVTVTFCIS